MGKEASKTSTVVFSQVRSVPCSFSKINKSKIIIHSKVTNCWSCDKESSQELTAASFVWLAMHNGSRPSVVLPSRTVLYQICFTDRFHEFERKRAVYRRPHGRNFWNGFTHLLVFFEGKSSYCWWIVDIDKTWQNLVTNSRIGYLLHQRASPMSSIVAVPFPHIKASSCRQQQDADGGSRNSEPLVHRPGCSQPSSHSASEWSVQSIIIIIIMRGDGREEKNLGRTPSTNWDVETPEQCCTKYNSRVKLRTQPTLLPFGLTLIQNL